MTLRRWLVVLSLSCLVYRPAVAGSNEGRQLAAACASCHGRSNEAGIPTLIGSSEIRIAQALQAYRSGNRVGQIMQVISASLGPGELEAVARAIAAQHPGSGR